MNRVGSHYSFVPIAHGQLVRTRFGNIPAIPDRRPYTSIVVVSRRLEDRPQLIEKNGRVLLRVNMRDLQGGSDWHEFEPVSAMAFISYQDNSDVWLENFTWQGNRLLRIVSSKSTGMNVN